MNETAILKNSGVSNHHSQSRKVITIKTIIDNRSGTLESPNTPYKPLKNIVKTEPKDEPSRKSKEQVLVKKPAKRATNYDSKKFKILWENDEWPKILSHLHFGHCLGQGSFAKVYEGFDKLYKKQVAIKVIEKKRLKDKKRRGFVEKELKILSMMNHNSIVKMIRLLEDHKRVFFITELCGSNTLSRFCRKK